MRAGVIVCTRRPEVRQKSRGALIAAMALIALDLVAGVFVAISAGGTPNPAGIVIRLAFLGGMWPAYGEMGKSE